MVEDGRKAIVGRAAPGFTMLALAVLTTACSQSDTAAKEGNFSSDAETAKVEKVVRDYILNNPEIIEQAFERRESGAMAKLVNVHRRDLETPFPGAWAGARDGDVVLVEFFDYACGFCRASNADVDRLLAEDKNLKVVWRELPGLGEPSLVAAQVSLAAAKQGRYKQFYDRMFAAGRPTPESIAKVQSAVGVKPMQSPEFTQELDKNDELARKLATDGPPGTPTWVVGDKILSGQVGYERLKDAIAEARKKA